MRRKEGELCDFIRIVDHILGMEYVGLNGLFTSILHVLYLAELGGWISHGLYPIDMTLPKWFY